MVDREGGAPVDGRGAAGDAVEVAAFAAGALAVGRRGGRGGADARPAATGCMLAPDGAAAADAPARPGGAMAAEPEPSPSCRPPPRRRGSPSRRSRSPGRPS